jgi:hypothetical protein
MIYVGLIENAAKSADCDFAVFGNDGGVGAFFGSADELDVTALLAMLREACYLEAALYLAKR